MEDHLRSLSATGPVEPGPGGSVQMHRGPEGHHVVLRLRDDLRGHHLVGEGMEEVAGFASTPGVPGVAPLSHWSRADGAFAYPVPDGGLLAPHIGRVASPRAALELLAGLATALARAAEAAEPHGLYAHGALSPWRVWLATDGGVTVLGYAVAPVELLAWLDEETDQAPGDGLRYAPPERIEDKGEDLRSDLFGAAMMAAELAVGGPLLEGAPDAVLDALVAGTAIDRLEDRGGALSDDALDLLCSLLEPAVGRRPKAGHDVAALAGLLAADAEGPPLAALVGSPAPTDDDEEEEDDDDEPITQVNALPTPPPREPTPAPPPRRAPPAPAPPRAAPPAPLRPPAAAAAPLAATPAPAPERDTPTPKLPTAIDDLGPDPAIDQVKAQGQRIVDRALAMAGLAESVMATLEARRDELTDASTLLAGARAQAERARKSAASAKSAASLLELDEDAAGAMITLDLVRNGERQCQQSTSEVLDLLAELDRARERRRQQARALAEAARRATAEADRATDAANQADDLVTRLETDARRGDLTAEGVDEALQEAVDAASAAHTAAEEARAEAEAARATDTADSASRCAEVAAQAAELAAAALQATVDAAERARRLEEEGRLAAASRAAEHQAEAEQAAEQAAQALARADEALLVARGASADDLRTRCEGHAATARSAAASAATAARAAEAAPTTDSAQAGAATAGQAAGRAREAAEEARALSDRIVRLAGEAAERRAAVSKAQAEAEALAEQAGRLAERARAEVDTLFQDTRGVSGERAVTLRAEALEFVQSTERGQKKAQAERERMAALDDPEQLVEGVGALRALIERVETSASRAHQRAAQARDEAERELAEIRRRQAARAAAAEAAAEARDHADTSREAVQKAWERAREVEAYLEQHPHAQAAALQRKALEIIDIAEFQAGEAASSAAMAEGEHEPSEARAHAQTAESFAQRIALDLPEALHALEEAETLARKEVTDRERARNHTAEVHASVQALVKGLGRVVEEARDDARQWADDRGVAANLQQLEALAAELAKDLTEAEYARDRARQVDAASEALSLVPVADAALQRARDKDQRGEALREALSKAVQSAAAEANALDEARRTVGQAAEAAAAALDAAGAASERLTAALETHQASGSEAHDAQLSLRGATERLRGTRDKLAELVQVATQAESSPIALRAAEAARKLVAQVERDREQIADDEARGTAAAAQEAKARAEALRRRLEAARDDARRQVDRAHQVVQRLDELLDDAEEESSETTHPDARALFERALDQGDQLKAQVAEIERRAEGVGSADDADRAEALSEATRGAAEALARAADAVEQLVQQARDQARAAAEEAEALGQVKDELASMVDRANEEVARAKDEAKRILGVLKEAPRSEVKTVAEQVTQYVQTATTAAAKVRAAAPLAAAADDLAVAQNILRTSRLALERARGAADAVAGLVTEAMERVRERKEAQARELDAARVRAAEPAREADAERLKADGWLAGGKALADAHPDRSVVQRPWALLKARCEAVVEAAALAAEAAVPAGEATSVADAQAHGARVRAAADRALEAGQQAREALQALRTAVDELQERLAQVQLTRQEAQDHAHAAEQAAEQADLTAKDLEKSLETVGPHHDVLVRFVEPARQGARRARGAAEEARAAATAAATLPDPDEVEDLADEAHKALAKALDGLERVVVCEAAFQERRTRLEADAEAERQAADAAQAQADAAARQAAEAAEAEEQARRQVRDEERRERFRRRAEERGNPNTTAAMDAATLKDRLRSRRPAAAADLSPAPSETPAAPRRARRRRSEEGDEGATRSVRRYTPGTRRPPEPTGPTPAPDAAPGAPARPARPRRAARPRPEREDNPNETKADALLERLRSRKRDGD